MAATNFADGDHLTPIYMNMLYHSNATEGTLGGHKHDIVPGAEGRDGHVTQINLATDVCGQLPAVTTVQTDMSTLSTNLTTEIADRVAGDAINWDEIGHLWDTLTTMRNNFYVGYVTCNHAYDVPTDAGTSLNIFDLPTGFTGTNAIVLSADAARTIDSNNLNQVLNASITTNQRLALVETSVVTSITHNKLYVYYNSPTGFSFAYRIVLIKMDSNIPIGGTLARSA
jgi:hypothetical protein